MQMGTFYIVATPIGNLEDMTHRAVHILNAVDMIAAEDTRYSKILLQHYGIKKPLLSLHNINEAKRIPELLSHLKEGKNIALISDAGTPLISDPGSLLVKKIREEGFAVVPIPGACAAIAALCASGFPTDRFVFEGFLSTKNVKRMDRLKALSKETRTVVFYEAPHRILELIEEIKEFFGASREIMLVKELTKTYETFFSGNADEIYAWLQEDVRRQKGEFVILVKGHEEDLSQDILSEEVSRMLDILLSELPVKQAALLVAKISGMKKNRVYDMALAKNEDRIV